MTDSSCVACVKRAFYAIFRCNRVTIGPHTVRVGKQIAEGGFSTVFQCTDVATGEKYALKQMIASEKEQIENILNEIRIHQRFSSHGNLLKLIAHSETQEAKHTKFLLLFPLYELGTIGDLLVRMREGGGQLFTERQALTLFRQVVSGVAAFHSQRIAHHDIKPENVLIAKDNTAVLMDFGSACKVGLPLFCSLLY